MGMSHMSKIEYFESVRERYLLGDKRQKNQILNELCQVLKCHRKSAIRRLKEPRVEDLKRRLCKETRGRKSKYRDPEFVKALRGLWFETNQLCSVNFKESIPLWLKSYRLECDLTDDIAFKLLSISSATISRVLQPGRYRTQRKGTTPGAMLRTQIPIRTNFWDVKIPGYMEADTVAHCGGSMSGEFTWTLTVTDIATTWTEMRAIWHKQSFAVRDAVEDIDQNLPFPIIGFDSDNGSEFINHTLVHYFVGKFIKFTRSREYRKNDNSHVEQKNWTHARGLLGYDRLDYLEAVPMLNELMRCEVSLFNNHFIPCLKLEAKERRQSKIYRHYDTPMTPYQRVLLSESVKKEVKDKLIELHSTLNPIILRRTIQAKLKQIFLLVKNNRKNNVTTSTLPESFNQTNTINP